MFLTRLMSFVLMLFMTLSSLARAAAWTQPRYQNETIEVIDIHQHVGDARTLGPLGREFLYRALPNWLPTAVKNWSLEAMANLVLKPYTPVFGVRQECINAGLSMCGLMAVYAPLTWGTVDNVTIENFLNDNRNRGPNGEPEYFFAMASLNIHKFPQAAHEELNELRRALSHRLMKGIKLAFVHNELPLDDQTFSGIYQVAREFSVPVYHHIGSSPLRPMKDFKSEEERKNYLRSSNPMELEWALKNYPDVAFVFGHMGFDFNREGFDFTDEVYALAEKYPNVYLEISAFGLQNYDPQGRFMDAVLKRLKEKKLVSRTLYGSDASGQPGAVKQYVKLTLASMERVGYSGAEVRAVMAENARTLYKLH